EKHPNSAIQYYYDNVNNHFYFQSIVENSNFSSKDDVFNYCWKLFIEEGQGRQYLEEFSNFIINTLEKFSPDL
uniref:hypothetical protein n=1 Tax=Acinetobacter brisouii TaxID=396323 RepID=UPI001C06B775